jgi:EF-hand domain pair/EF hand
MQNQELQQHNTQDGHSRNSQAPVEKGVEQKLHADAYQGAPPAAEAAPGAAPGFAPRGPHKSDEQLKAEYVEKRMATFHKMDANHDGKLSIEETVKYDRIAVTKALHDSETRFSKYEMATLDLNHDGVITLKEYEKARAWTHESDKQLAAEFKARDLNGDGHITFSEIKAFDAKRDGVIDKSIIKSVEDMDRKHFQSMDVNHDGKLSLAEYLAPSISMPSIWSAMPCEAAQAAPATTGDDAPVPPSSATPAGRDVTPSPSAPPADAPPAAAVGAAVGAIGAGKHPRS